MQNNNRTYPINNIVDYLARPTILSAAGPYDRRELART